MRFLHFNLPSRVVLWSGTTVTVFMTGPVSYSILLVNFHPDYDARDQGKNEAERACVEARYAPHMTCLGSRQCRRTDAPRVCLSPKHWCICAASVCVRTYFSGILTVRTTDAYALVVTAFLRLRI